MNGSAPAPNAVAVAAQLFPWRAGSPRRDIVSILLTISRPRSCTDRQWAFTVLERTLDALRRECGRQKKEVAFEELEGFLPNGRGSVSRVELAAKHGISVNAVNVAIHRVRQRFGALLRQQVAETVSSEGEVDEEIRCLMSVLAA